MMSQLQEYPLIRSDILSGWHSITRRLTLRRGMARISAALCRRLLPPYCITRSAYRHFMAISSRDGDEACALCGCLARHVTGFIWNFLRPGDIFIDGGANIGQVTLLAASRVGPLGKVLAYEPNRIVARRLSLACQANHYGWVTLREVALGSQSGVVSFCAASNSQLSSLFELPERLGTYQKTVTQMVVLDDELALLGLENKPVTMVKLDLEGGELEALSGMSTLLSGKIPPVAVVELNTQCRAEGKAVVKQIVDWFYGRGLEGFIIEPRNIYLANEPPHLTRLQTLPEIVADAIFICPETPDYQRLLALVH